MNISNVLHPVHTQISGPQGQIELATTPPKRDVTLQNITAIFCHPHPLHGGTMNNKVVTTLAKTVSELGITAVRFNFRGVGLSEGTYGEGILEQSDLLAVHDWVRAQSPEHQIWIGGFSFGAYVALSSVPLINPDLILTVAPAVNHFDSSEISAFTVPWILVQGEKDNLVSAQDVYYFAKRQFAHNPPTIVSLPDADHFFHGQINALRNALRAQLTQFLNPIPSA